MGFLIFVIIPVGFAMIITAGFTGLCVMMMVCQIFKLWPWCFLFTLFESEHMAKSEMFLSPWFKWLRSSPTSFDWERRFEVSFRILGKFNCLRLSDKSNEELSQAVLRFPPGDLTCRAARRDILQMRSNTWAFCCGIPQEIASSPAHSSNFTEERRARGVQDDQWI